MLIVGKPASSRILVVRLGAMGDIIHTLPAVASLKHNFPGSHLTWAVEPRWIPLLEENPFIDRLALVRRDGPANLLESWRDLRSARYDFAVDFQGLLKSALVASAAHADRIFGFQEVRERMASVFYSTRTPSRSVHVVDRNLDLAASAGAGTALRTFPLPQGRAEGELPAGDFVLASPLAGWRSKQWPMEHYASLADRLSRELGIPLVLNVPPDAELPPIEGAVRHSSSLAGLIWATRRAAAVLGVDSGPLHLAAALGKPGAAVFGPTDPKRNGPYGGSLQTLRSPTAVTTYKRGAAIAESMRQVGPDQVFEALRTALGESRRATRCMV